LNFSLLLAKNDEKKNSFFSSSVTLLIHGHTHTYFYFLYYSDLYSLKKNFFFSKQIHVHIYTTLIITVILKIQLHHITVTHSLFSYTLVYYKGQLLSFLFSLFVVFNNDIASCCRHTLAYFIDTITYKEYL